MPGEISSSLRKADPLVARAIQARWLHVILLFLGLVGWLIFILACVGGPAWSPDGSQILFAYRDVDNSRTSVALYDRTKGNIRVIFSQPYEKEGELALHPQWQRDGKRALVAIFGGTPDRGDDGCQLVSIPITSKLPLQVYNLGQTPGCIYTYPQMNDRVYFAGTDLRWVDLKTGKVNSSKFKMDGKDSDEEQVLLSEGNGGLYYQRSLKRKVQAADGTEHDENGEELGRLQTEESSFRPSFVFWDRDLHALGVESDATGTSPISIAPDGSRSAMIASKNGDDSDSILLMEDKKGVVRVFNPDLGRKPFELGNLTWSADTKILYASVLTRTDAKDVQEYWLAEIPLDGSRVRLTKIASVNSEMNTDFEDVFHMAMDVSLSPDGRWIAATPAVLGEKMLAPADRALVLIDLHDPARRLKKVPIPHQPAE